MDLIKIEKSKGGKDVVSAHELHKFLISDSKQNDVGTDFTTWCKRMLEYGFKENVDYITICYNFKGDIIGESNKQHVAKRDFVLTLDTAKHIAMIQRNDKGMKARNYFIACEKRQNKVSLPKTYAEALIEAGRLALEVEQKESLLLEQAPKVEFYDAVTQSQDELSIGEAYKILNLGYE